MGRLAIAFAACLLWAGSVHAESCSDDPEKPASDTTTQATDPQEADSDEKDPSFYWQMALNRVQIRDYENAERSLRLLLEIKPGDGYGMYARSYCWMMRRQYIRALGLLTAVVPKVPTKEVGYNGGVLFSLLGQDKDNRRKSAALSARFSAAAQEQPYVQEGLKEGVEAYQKAYDSKIKPLIDSVQKQIDRIETQCDAKKRDIFKVKTEYDFQRDKGRRLSAELAQAQANKQEQEANGEPTGRVEGEIRRLEAEIEKQVDVVRKLYIDLTVKQDELDSFDDQIEDLKDDGRRQLNEIEVALFKFNMEEARNHVVGMLNLDMLLADAISGRH